jgi:hypothetical protein
VIIASGLMAGGALGGVLGAAPAAVPLVREDWIKTPFYSTTIPSRNRFRAAVRGLCGYVWFGA